VLIASVAWCDVILHAAAELLADARGTLGFRGTPVENHCYSLICGSHKSKHLSQNMTQCQYLMVSEEFIKNVTVNYISCVNERPVKICD